MVTSIMMLSSCAILEQILIMSIPPPTEQQAPTTDANDKGSRIETNGPSTNTETRSDGDGMKDVEPTNDRVDSETKVLGKKNGDLEMDNMISSLGVSQDVGNQLKTILRISGNEKKTILQANKGNEQATSQALSKLKSKTEGNIKSILSASQYQKYIDIVSKGLNKVKDEGPLKTGKINID